MVQPSSPVAVAFGYYYYSNVKIGFSISQGRGFEPINEFTVSQNSSGPYLTMSSERSSISVGLNPKLQISLYSIVNVEPGLKPYVGVNLYSDRSCSLLYGYQFFYGVDFTLDIPPIILTIFGFNFTFTFGVLPYSTSYPIIPQQNMMCPRFCGCLGSVNYTAMGENTDDSGSLGEWIHGQVSPSLTSYIV